MTKKSKVQKAVEKEVKDLENDVENLVEREGFDYTAPTSPAVPAPLPEPVEPEYVDEDEIFADAKEDPESEVRPDFFGFGRAKVAFNLRKEPNKESQETSSVQRDTLLEVISTQEDENGAVWIEVKNNQNSVSGWTYSNLVKPEEE
jgi:hypothetical protein